MYKKTRIIKKIKTKIQEKYGKKILFNVQALIFSFKSEENKLKKTKKQKYETIGTGWRKEGEILVPQTPSFQRHTLRQMEIGNEIIIMVNSIK